MTISTNAVGIETAGSGRDHPDRHDHGLTSQDVVITGSSQWWTIVEGTVDVDSVDVTGARYSSLACELWTCDPQLPTRMPLLGATVSSPRRQTVAQQVQRTTGANGVASDLTFTYQQPWTADGKDVPSLAGYTAMTVAEVEYAYTSTTDSIADFRHADTAGVSLTDAGRKHRINCI